MKKIVAAFIAGLILATAGLAGASTQGLTLERIWHHDKKQDRQIERLKGMDQLLLNGMEVRIELLRCELRPAPQVEDCKVAVERAYDYVEWR